MFFNRLLTVPGSGKQHSRPQTACPPDTNRRRGRSRHRPCIRSSSGKLPLRPRKQPKHAIVRPLKGASCREGNCFRVAPPVVGNPTLSPLTTSGVKIQSQTDMKIERPQTARRFLSTPRILAGTIAALFAAHSADAAPIAWGPATTIAGDADVLNAGLFNYAYDLSNTAATLNGVAFTGSNSTTALGANVTLTGWNTNNGTAFGTGAGNPYALLSAAYKNVLKGGTYTTGATTATVTLNNLTFGRTYAAQVWVNDNRSGATATRSPHNSSGGNSRNATFAML